MQWLGDYNPEAAVIDFKFTTIDSSGAGATLSGSPTLCIYRDNGTTEITAGITLTVDFDGKTGLNHVRIVGTTAGLVGGKDHSVCILTGTVAGVSVVGYVVGQFSTHNRSVHEAIYYGSVTSTSTASSVIDSNASAVFAANNAAVGLVFKWISGALVQQAGIIGTYTISPNTFGFDTSNDFTGAPSVGDRFMVL